MLHGRSVSAADHSSPVYAAAAYADALRLGLSEVWCRVRALRGCVLELPARADSDGADRVTVVLSLLPFGWLLAFAGGRRGR